MLNRIVPCKPNSNVNILLFIKKKRTNIQKLGLERAAISYVPTGSMFLPSPEQAFY